MRHPVITIVFALLCIALLAACDTNPAPTPQGVVPTLPVSTATLQAVAPTATAKQPPATDTVPAQPTSVPDTATVAPKPSSTTIAELPAPSATATYHRPTAQPTHTRVEPSSTPAVRPTSTHAPAVANSTKVGQATATSTPPVTNSPRLEVLASGFGNPDDLVVLPSGDIVFGDFSNNALNILRPGAQPVPIVTGLNEPEGIVVAQDGALIVAEQKTNRLTEADPTTGAKKLLRQLVNNTSNDGVDGLGIDPATGDILIPDSPNGRLLRMSRDGSKLSTIATGFVRPTGVAVEPGGSLVVADEFGNAVYRLSVSGRRTRIASIYQPDDVVVGRDGSIYVNSLGGTISRIDPSTGRVSVLASGLKLPHGIGIDPQGDVIVAEAGRNRILRILVSIQ